MNITIQIYEMKIKNVLYRKNNLIKSIMHSFSFTWSEMNLQVLTLMKIIKNSSSNSND